MKQLFSTILLTLLLSMAGISASAYNIAVENDDGVTIYYTFTNNRTELAVSSFNRDYENVVVIPESVTYGGTTYPVTSIDSEAFYGCSGLTSITIPNSVTSIGNEAFYGCKDLTNVTVPYSVTSIGESAFEGCSGLTSVTIANSVTSIGEYAFYECSGLSNVTIPNSVKSIGICAFASCSGLTSIIVEEGNTVYDSRDNCNAIIETASNNLIVGFNNTTIPNSVTSIGSCAFWKCSDLTCVDIPNSVTSIGESAFEGCSGLTSVEIPNSVTSIGKHAFYYCSGLTSVTIPNSVTSIGASVLSNCSALTSITIPNTVTNIGENAFSGCSGLTSIDIPNSVTSIGYKAFYGCKGLTSVTIPNSVTSIGDYAFEGCSGLTSIIVEEGNTVYDSRNNCNAIIETASNTLVACCMNTIIPNSVTSISDYSFYGCTGLTSIDIPNSVTSIGDYSFYGCTGLTSIDIPNSVTSIGDYSFYGCTGLTSVTIPKYVRKINYSAFYGCTGLTSVSIPNSVTYIDAFAFQNCSALTDVYCYAESVPTTDTHSFYRSSYQTATLHVPESSIDSYKSTWLWRSFGKIVALPSKCANPVITFSNGEFTFDCETEGVEFHYILSLVGETAGVGNKIPAVTSYRITVYATKEGYTDSDVATIDIDFNSIKGDANGDGEITISDAVSIVNTILGNNGSENARMKK